MKMFSDCSGPCETCANNKPGVNCLAGHGDDHYVEREMPNIRNRVNLKAQIDLLSDAHSDIAQEAARANKNLLLADEAGSETGLFFADSCLLRLEEDLEEQAARCLRVRAEIEQIRKNIRVD